MINNERVVIAGSLELFKPVRPMDRFLMNDQKT